MIGRKIIQTKKAQLDIIAWIVVVAGLLIVAPILWKAVDSSLTGLANGLNSTSPTAAATVTHISGTFTNWLDGVIVIGFLVNTILLFVFAFMIDTHPLFAVFYLISAIFTVMFGPYVIEPAKEIFNMPTLSDAVAKLPMTNFILTKFNIILLAVIVITGIILYAKIRGSGGRDPYS